MKIDLRCLASTRAMRFHILYCILYTVYFSLYTVQVLGFDPRDADQIDTHWNTITNRDAIEINQDYAGEKASCRRLRVEGFM